MKTVTIPILKPSATCLVELALDVSVGRAEDEVVALVVLLRGGRERAALVQLLLKQNDKL